MIEPHVHTCTSRNRSTISAANRSKRVDPTRTTTLRMRFVRDMDKRFRALKREISTSIIENDCFGIQPEVLRLLSAAPKKAFDFTRSADKVQAFIAWLEEQEELGVLEIIRLTGMRAGMEVPWTNVYIDTAYAQGIRRGRAELRSAGWLVPGFEHMPEGVSALFNQPYHIDRIGAIYSRTYEDLKTVTREMNAQIRRTIADGLTTGLARGMAEGKNPGTIARELVRDISNRVDKIGITRARMIARTEVIRAHHVANIAEYQRANEMLEVTVMAEWSSAGFDVCPECVELEHRGPYTLTKIEGMIPVHPNCVNGNTIIETPDIRTGIMSTYSGPIIKFQLANGARLSVTPNHMLATPDGFVMAKFLSQGDAVLCSSNGQRTTLGDPDDNGNPARIDNLIRAFAETPGVATSRVPVTTKDLHGDGGACQGDVYIVNPDGFLGDDLNTQNGRGIFDILSGNGSFSTMVDRLLAAPDRSMGSSREGLAFLRGCLRHAQKHGFAPISRRDAVLLETANNNASIATKMLSQLFDREPGAISHEELVNLYRQAVVCNSSNPEINSRSTDSIFNGIPFCHAIDSGQLGEAFSGQISRVCVVGVEIDHCTDLSVYDVSTSSTVYFANGILSSNCRCCAIPVMKERT